jgi:hypothetical protein
MRLTKYLLTLIGCVGLLSLATGCSSVMCGSRQSVSINSRPAGAEVLVYNSDCKVVFKKKTPCVAKLDRGTSDGGAANYVVLIRKQGFAPVQVPLTGKVNDAYYANILLGGVGAFVDNASGAKWTLTPEEIDADAGPQGSTTFQTEDVVVSLQPRTTEEQHHALAEYKPNSQE